MSDRPNGPQHAAGPSTRRYILIRRYSITRTSAWRPPGSLAAMAQNSVRPRLAWSPRQEDG